MIPDVNLLLDTHVFIWWDANDRRLSKPVREAIEDFGNRAIVSAASIWEISIKRTTGKLKFHHDTLAALDRNGFESLNITPIHAEAAGSLPLLHADPFDRLLVAQARHEGLVLVTQDRQFLSYGVPLLGVT
jgi:PIN domain nuclease of toxin-antitoxin system